MQLSARQAKALRAYTEGVVFLRLLRFAHHDIAVFHRQDRLAS